MVQILPVGKVLPDRHQSSIIPTVALVLRSQLVARRTGRRIYEPLLRGDGFVASGLASDLGERFHKHITGRMLDRDLDIQACRFFGGIQYLLHGLSNIIEMHNWDSVLSQRVPEYPRSICLLLVAHPARFIVSRECESVFEGSPDIVLGPVLHRDIKDAHMSENLRSDVDGKGEIDTPKGGA